MSLRIVQRSRARQDVLEIIAYIADRNPQAAGRVLAAYERSLTSLARNPEIGWLYPTDNPKLAGFRAFPIGRFRSYLIFYRHTADTLDVIRVLHGRRDLATLLREEETTPASLRALQEQAKRSGATKLGLDEIEKEIEVVRKKSRES
jgi:toxin ParE1/3/4